MAIDCSRQSEPGSPSKVENIARPPRPIRQLPARAQTGRETKVTISWGQFGLKSTCVVKSEVLETRGQKRGHEDDVSDEEERREDIDDRPRKRVAREDSLARVSQWLNTSSVAASGVQAGGMDDDADDEEYSTAHLEEEMADTTGNGDGVPMNAGQESGSSAKCRDGGEAESALDNDRLPDGSGSSLPHHENHSDAASMTLSTLLAQDLPPHRHEHTNYDGDSDDSLEVCIDDESSLPSKDKGKQREPPPCSPSWDRLEGMGSAGSADATLESSAGLKKYAFDQLRADIVAEETPSKPTSPTIHHPTPLRPEDRHAPPKPIEAYPPLEPLTMEKIMRLYPNTQRSEGRVHHITEDRIARPRAPAPTQYRQARANYLLSKATVKATKENLGDPQLSIDEIIRMTNKCAITESAVKAGRRAHNPPLSVAFGPTTTRDFRRMDRPSLLLKRQPLEIPSITYSREDLPGERRTGKKAPAQIEADRAQDEAVRQAESAMVKAALSGKLPPDPDEEPLVGPSTSPGAPPVAGPSTSMSSPSTHSLPPPQMPGDAAPVSEVDSSRVLRQSEESASATTPPVLAFDLSILQDALPPSTKTVPEPPAVMPLPQPATQPPVTNEHIPTVAPPTSTSIPTLASTSTPYSKSSAPSVSVPQGSNDPPSVGLGAAAFSHPPASPSSWQGALPSTSSLPAECYADGSFGVLPDVGIDFDAPLPEAMSTPFDADFFSDIATQVFGTQQPALSDPIAAIYQQTLPNWQGSVYAQTPFPPQDDDREVAEMARRMFAEADFDPEELGQWSEANLGTSYRHLLDAGAVYENIGMPPAVPQGGYEEHGSSGQQAPPLQQPNGFPPPASTVEHGVPQFSAQETNPYAWLDGTDTVVYPHAMTPSGVEYWMLVGAAVLNGLAYSIAYDPLSQRSLPPAELAMYHALPLELQQAIWNWDGGAYFPPLVGEPVFASWIYSPWPSHASAPYQSVALPQEPQHTSAPDVIKAVFLQQIEASFPESCLDAVPQGPLDAELLAAIAAALEEPVTGPSASVEEQDETMSGPSPPPEEPTASAEVPRPTAPVEEPRPVVEEPATQEPPREAASTAPAVPESATEVPPPAQEPSAPAAPSAPAKPAAPEAPAEASAEPSPRAPPTQPAPSTKTSGRQTDTQPRAAPTTAPLSLDDITLAVVELYARLEYAHCTRPEVFVSEDLRFVPEGAARARNLDPAVRRRLLSPLHAERIMCEAVWHVQAAH